MTNNTYMIRVLLEGIRPMMLDRYAGDNSTSLPVEEKVYLTADRLLMIPAINIYSLLCAENSKSVCRQFFGKQGKTIGLGIGSYTSIEPFDIPILEKGAPIAYTGINGKITIHTSVARVKGGIPNPKQRPLLSMPWELSFSVAYTENKYCTLENLRQAFAMGGTLGVGTFRPFFGRYHLSQFNVE